MVDDKVRNMMKWLKKGAAPVVLTLMVGSQLYAQPAPEPKGPKKGADVMLRESQELDAQVRVHNQRVQHLQATARKEKDVIKLSCVNDKYVRLKAESNMFDAARRDFNAAGEAEQSTAYGRVVDAAARVAKIREEAEACAGEPELTASESLNEVNHPEILDDPTQGSPFGTFEVEPPSYASPYK